MNSPSRTREIRALSAFELIVILVVVGVLIALLFPMINGPTGGSRRGKARQDALAIVHAIEQYATEYNALPKPDPLADGSSDAAVGDPAAGMRLDNATLFNILRAIDRPPNAKHVQNPKQQIFFGAPSVSNTKTPKEGFLEVAGHGGVQGAFYDPWGSQYNIVLDSNSDNSIDVKAYYPEFVDRDVPMVAVGAFVLGRDRKLGKDGDRKYRNGSEKSDDIVSWSSN